MEQKTTIRLILNRQTQKLHFSEHTRIFGVVIKHYRQFKCVWRVCG
jgi:hypothetical protein